MKKMTILIKPVSSLCNMDCFYCFYKEVAEKRKKKTKIMNKETISNIVRETMLFCDEATTIEFCFQGGEPLLAGMNFYLEFINEVNKQNCKNKILYSIQTNGILIDESWIKLFKEYDFLIGISLDGIETTHNRYRTINQKSSFNEVIKVIEMLNMAKLKYNILTVVSSYTSNYSQEIYEFYKKMNFQYVQFIPCLDTFERKNGLKPNEYSNFFISLYKNWNADRRMHINLFEEIESLLMGNKLCSCGMLGYCSLQIVIESDGNVYPCDFYALDEYCLGNINQQSLNKIIKNKNVLKFLREEKNFSNLCDNCSFYRICYGNCKRQNACMFNEEYCGYKELLEYIYENKMLVKKQI